MGIQTFGSQEEMDDSFEDLMETEQEKARLKEAIEHQQYEVENCEQALKDAKDELDYLVNALVELQAAGIG